MIPSHILKDLAEELAPILIEIFRRTLADREVPVDWRSAKFMSQPSSKRVTDSGPATPDQSL